MAYDREKAVAYAFKWAYGFNPDFFNFDDLGGDCTNFASQCLYAGGLPMNYTPTYGWYYIDVNSRAPAWTGVNELYRFLITNTGIGPKAVEVDFSGLEIADLIQINFGDDPSFDHTPIVVDVGERTSDTILVAAHSYAANCRPLSSYNYRKIRCLHITD